MRTIPTLALMLAPLVALPLRAQHAPAAQPGDSVLVTARALGMFDRPGVLQRTTPDSLTFRDATAGGAEVTVALDAIDDLRVNFGNQPPRHAVGRGIGYGALIGAGLGALTGAVTYKHAPACSGDACFGNALYLSQSEQTVAYAAVGALGGMLVGGILGATVIHRSNYHDVKPSALGAVASALTGEGDVALRPAFDPRTHTEALSLSVRF
jgi:hypothetical protein